MGPKEILLVFCFTDAGYFLNGLLDWKHFINSHDASVGLGMLSLSNRINFSAESRFLMLALPMLCYRWRDNDGITPPNAIEHPVGNLLWMDEIQHPGFPGKYSGDGYCADFIL